MRKKNVASVILCISVLLNDAISRLEYRPGASKDNQQKTANFMEAKEVI
jgi:hypothetical protein